MVLPKKKRSGYAATQHTENMVMSIPGFASYAEGTFVYEGELGDELWDMPEKKKKAKLKSLVEEGRRLLLEKGKK